ncbi:hypothetical protein [Cellulosimicrobium protaetiae]|uniref:Uncharacterized protein n=1 Tax=Cellulosimicrobium protaetiae TaxID=2587808 RepID=A0A6M5UKC8_9MICO|nr:hypothetical protein [Cellulosimicrobium protaetiae]QJW37129.1 hypothetical protein FIC82_013975 [Cellulosimicrobium protaetiae]
MVWMFVWLGLTLGVAAVVFLFASVVARSEAQSTAAQGDRSDEGMRAFWRDFRSGLRRRRRRGGLDAHHVGTVRMPRPVDTSIDDFFTATEVTSNAYVDAEELTDVLHRARARVRPLHTGERPPQA